MSPKIVDKEKKRLHIRDSAMKVFAGKGFNRTKMTDIARTAGIGKGTIYEYFNSKEEIYSEIFTFFFDQLDKDIKASLSTTDDPIKKMKIVNEKSTSLWKEDNKDFIGLMMDFWAEGMRQEGKDSMYKIPLEQVYDGIRLTISGIIDEGIEKGIFKPIDSSGLASILMAAYDGLYLQWYVEPEKVNLESASQLILYGFLYGIIEKEYQI